MKVYSLATGPDVHGTKLTGCIVNSVRFNVIQDGKSGCRESLKIEANVESKDISVEEIRLKLEESVRTFEALEDGKLKKISSIIVFIDRLDWLDVWDDIKLTDAFDKLKPETKNKISWSTEFYGVAILFAQENNKSPAIASVFH
ncbi:hypothetical protein BC332_13441 [Capsicum chinense]|nr:hypothetical protein BC332_13441 [Capsicum chinense]